MRRNAVRTHAASALPPRDVWTLLTDGILLLCAVLGTCYAVLTAYRLPPGGTPLLAVCLVSTLVSLSIFSMPRKGWIPLLILVLLGGAAVRRLWGILLIGLQAIGLQIYQILADNLWFLAPLPFPLPVPDPGTEAAVALTLLFFAAGLALLLGISMVRFHSHWLTLLLMLVLLLPALCAEAWPEWSPFLAMIAAWTTLWLSSLSRRAAPRETARLTALALPAIGLLLTGLTLLLPSTDYTRPLWADQAKFQLNTLGNHLLSLWQELGPSGSASPSSGGEGEMIDLAAAGPRQYTGRRVLNLESDQTGKFYLRGISAAVYDGSSWTQLDDTAYAHLEETTGYRFSGAGQPLFFPAEASSSKALHTLTITNIAAPDTCLYLPYHLVSASQDELQGQFVRDSYLAPSDSVWSRTVIFQSDILKQGAEPSLSGAAARWELFYRSFVYEFYTQVPEGFWTASAAWRLEAQDLDLPVSDLSAYPAQYQPVLETALQIGQALAATTEYDASAPYTPEGEDFVLWFLNESHQGYCMHYASAAVLLLRAQGIPARYVSGYTATLERPGRTDVPDSAAHAWVELYLDGYGWYPLEVTPGGGGVSGSESAAMLGELPPVSSEEAIDSTPAPAETAPPALTAVPGDEAVSSSPTPAPTPELLDEPASGPVPFLPLLLLFGIGLSLLLLSHLRRRLVRWLRELRFRSPDTNRAAIAAYRCLLRLEPWGGEISERIQALAGKAAFSPHVLTEEERAVLVDYLHQETLYVDQNLTNWKRFLFRYLYALH